jgi:hypothetical protein
MAHYSPGSQRRSVMAEKEQLARRLIASGLLNSQIKLQLRCSDHFVRRIRQEMDSLSLQRARAGD